MPRNMSFAMTLEQVRQRTKTVTRRFGWWSLEVGTVLCAVEKGMGLKKGERIKRISRIRVVSVRKEPLNAITQADVVAEGFPDWTPEQFVQMLVKHYGCDPAAECNRIEFEYVELHWETSLGPGSGGLKVVPSPRRDDWETPNWLFQQLHDEFSFTVDAAAHDRNHKLERYWSQAEDGLAQDWGGERVWVNPPYGKGIDAWVEKARRSDALVVMLLPVRTETSWWCQDVIHASEIRFIRGRVKFKLDRMAAGGPDGSNPVFASALVVFGDGRGPRLSTVSTPAIQARERQMSLHEHVCRREFGDGFHCQQPAGHEGRC